MHEGVLPEGAPVGWTCRLPLRQAWGTGLADFRLNRGAARLGPVKNRTNPHNSERCPSRLDAVLDVAIASSGPSCIPATHCQKMTACRSLPPDDHILVRRSDSHGS